MSKVFLFNMVTLDGYFEGPNHDLAWHNVDAEFNEFAIQQLGEIDTLLFGRKTYELMASYWPTEAGVADDPVVAGLMNSLPKVVISRSLKAADWQNSRLVKDDLAGEVSKLKQKPGKDIAIFGSANLASALTDLGLIDEYRIIVAPVILGKGEPLFQGVQNRLDLQLTQTRVFKSGNVLLYYQPARK